MNKEIKNLDVSDIAKECYQALRKIPKGKVTTYKILGDYLGCKSYRAVGQILKRNPLAPDVPCHRVVKTTGDIGGYAFGVNKKVKMLQDEGLSVKNKQVQDLESVVYWF